MAATAVEAWDERWATPEGRADSTIAVRRNGAGSGAHHFRLAHLGFALMMTARAQPTTRRGGADGGDGG